MCGGCSVSVLLLFFAGLVKGVVVARVPICWVVFLGLYRRGFFGGFLGEVFFRFFVCVVGFFVRTGVCSVDLVFCDVCVVRCAAYFAMDTFFSVSVFCLVC